MSREIQERRFEWRRVANSFSARTLAERVLSGSGRRKTPKIIQRFVLLAASTGVLKQEGGSRLVIAVEGKDLTENLVGLVELAAGAVDERSGHSERPGICHERLSLSESLLRRVRISGLDEEHGECEVRLAVAGIEPRRFGGLRSGRPRLVLRPEDPRE